MIYVLFELNIMCYVNVWDCVCYVFVYEFNWDWLCCDGYIVVMFMYACNWDWNRIVIEVVCV